ncbi:cytochrome P450 family protein [Cavenderia fasciculata]|uniref:Cytochrome P450 family protein n=1 Tax=Cavenderia fasciculata TaxID=261658 RepID=F4Q643_CACFS|nr:cytochrome P450 family protein [Cavenderia fasciculata]EGG16629.1 cytochrome P450 family protein [Cavenderia fasciculata]|eukprot:XP_004355103.1 cytochrome P450 family protein [Cavenderia fasciculata]
MRYVLNIISKHAFSKETDYDETLKDVGFFSNVYYPIHRINQLMAISFATSLSNILAPISYLIKLALQRDYDTLLQQLNSIYNEHLSTLDPENPRDLCDLMIVSNYEKEFIINTCYDMYTGLDTILHTLEWSLLMLNNYPIKSMKLLVDNNNNKSPNLNAFILEVFRYRPTAILSFPRRCTQDTIIGDFFYPKDSLVGGNIDSINHDPDYFDDPFTFDPQRFVNPPIGELNNKDNLCHFGVGPRMCLGANLAMDTLYTAISNIILGFKVTGPNGEYQFLDEAEQVKIFSAPKNHSYLLIPRVLSD